MTTASWSTRVRHDSDATWQEWRDELITKLGTLSTYLAADETNITAGAGARPGTSTEGGYAVYHLSDSLHATAPCYIRFGFGTHTSATAPRIQVTTGTTTNGSGVLGGTALSTIAGIHANAVQVTDTARQSYMSAHNGHFGLNWKTGASVTEAAFFFGRTCDSAGAISATGAIAVWGNGTAATLTKTQAFRFAATAVAYTLQTAVGSTALGLSPQSPTVTAVGSDNQAFLGWTITPAVAPLFHVCGVLDTEVTTGNTFSVALVGSTARTYIGLSTLAGPFTAVSAVAANGPKYAMLWE